jgi:hypothetical protein
MKHKYENITEQVGAGIYIQEVLHLNLNRITLYIPTEIQYLVALLTFPADVDILP